MEYGKAMSVLCPLETGSYSFHLNSVCITNQITPSTVFFTTLDVWESASDRQAELQFLKVKLKIPEFRC